MTEILLSALVEITACATTPKLAMEISQAHIKKWRR